MKGNRLVAIREIIEEEVVSTQEELLAILRARGFDVTQATVSRDIKTLRLSKITDREGVTRYVMPAEVSADRHSEKYSTIFRESVLSIAPAGNLVVIKCFTGMGNAACAALDSMSLSSIVGTIAGDDTIFCALRSDAEAAALIQKLKDLMG